MLSEREMRILAFERSWWRQPGAKEREILEVFGIPSPAWMATPRRAVPTPGSTTATCTAGGRYGIVWASTAAPRRTSPGGTRWVMSISRMLGRIRAATPWQAATNPSSIP